MGFSGFLFVGWRLFQLITLIPPVGMLAWFIHGYVQSNQLTPTMVLLIFIVTVLALAWVFFTLIGYLRARHDAFFVAFVDLCFFGALIASVVVLRDIAGADCNNFTSEPIFADLGVFGLLGVQVGSEWADDLGKNCRMLQASWAFGIINIVAFFVTFFLALFVGRNHRKDDKVKVVKETREIHHTSSRRGDRRRSASRDHRDYRDSRDGYRPSRDEYRPSSRRQSVQRSESRRQYYV